MLLTPHAIIGAAIGAQIHRPWLVVPLAIGSHFLLDSIPHWDLDTEDLDKKDILVVLLDLFLSLVLTWLLTFDNPQWEMMWVGAICATVPDSHHLLHVLFGPESLVRYTKAHEKYHSARDIRFLPGIALQVIFITIAILIMGR